MAYPEYRAGNLAYDLAQLDPVVIVDPDVGPVKDLDSHTRDRVVTAPGNRAIGFGENTQCMEVTFLTLSSDNRKRYTFPATRIGIPRTTIEGRFSPAQYVEYKLLRKLLFEAEHVEPAFTDELIELAEGLADEESLRAAKEAVLEDSVDAEAE